MVYSRADGLLQSTRPRHGLLGMDIAQVDAHDHEGIEPQAGLVKVDLCDMPIDLAGDRRMGNGLHDVGLVGTDALALLQDPTVFKHQAHLIRVRLLDGEDVIPRLVDELRQSPRATARVPAHEEQAPDGLC